MLSCLYFMCYQIYRPAYVYIMYKKIISEIYSSKLASKIISGIIIIQSQTFCIEFRHFDHYFGWLVGLYISFSLYNTKLYYKLTADECWLRAPGEQGPYDNNQATCRLSALLAYWSQPFFRFFFSKIVDTKKS